MKRERIGSLDTIKGFACLIIAFLWHYLILQPKAIGVPFERLFNPFYTYGQYLVELFFMISGFVIAYCYKDKIMERMDFFPYMIKRYKHLYPLFFITLMFMLVMEIAYKAVAGVYYVYSVSPWHFILNLLGMQSGWFGNYQSFDGPAWCIGVEILLYILYYMTTKLSKKDNNAYILICIAMSLVGINAIFKGYDGAPIMSYFSMRGVACFYMGALVCEVNDYITDEDRKNELASKLLILLIVFRIALKFIPGNGFWGDELQGQMMLIMVQWPILIFSAINCRLFRRALELKGVNSIGKISMEVFLWHIPVQITIKTIEACFNMRINYGNTITWVIYIISTILVVLAYKYLYGKIKQVHYFKLSIATVIVTFLALGFLNVTGFSLKASIDNSINSNAIASSAEIREGESLEEMFFVPKDTHLKMIQFYTLIYNKEGAAAGDYIKVSLLDEDGNCVFTNDLPLTEINNSNVQNMEAFGDIPIAGNKWYRVVFTKFGGADVPVLVGTTADAKGSEGAFVNGNSIGQYLAMKVWTKER